MISGRISVITYQFLAVKPLGGQFILTKLLLDLPPVFSYLPTALHSAIDSTEVARGLSVSQAGLDRMVVVTLNDPVHS